MADVIDNPIQFLEEDVIQDTPVNFTDVLYASSPELDNFRALKAAFLNNYNTGDSVAEGFKKFKGEFDKTNTLLRLSSEKADLDNQALIEEFENSAVTGVEDFVKTGSIVNTLREETTKKALDVDGQFVDSVSTPETSEADKKEVANTIRLYEMLEESLQPYSTGDFVMDFGAQFVPFLQTAKEANLLGSVINNEDKMRGIIFAFKSKSPEEQQEMFPKLAKEFLEGLGPLRGADALTKFIDPQTEEELGDFSNIWKLFDVADVASIGAAIAFKADSLRKAFNMPKVIKAAGNTKKAGEANTAALMAEEAAAAQNLTTETAVGNALPFDISIEDPAYTKGLSTSSLKAMEEFFGKADRTVNEVLAGNNYLREGILSTVERAVVETSAYNKLKKAEHEDIVITGRTENTTLFSYKTVDEDGNIVDEQFTLELTLDDVGQWKQDFIGTISEILASPTVFAKGLTRLDVNTAQRLDLQTAKVFRALTELQREAVKPLGNLLLPANRDRLRKVERALIEGDEYKNADGSRGTVFSVEELKGQYHLDNAEMETYYNTNRLYNHLFNIRNNVKREEMIAFGYKHIIVDDNAYSYGKPFSSDGAAFASMNRAGVTQVYDPVLGKVQKSVTKEFLEEQYALGKVLVNLPESFDAGAEVGRVTYMLVDSNSIRELPATVLNRKVGYVPRVYENGAWFVKQFSAGTVDGREVERASVRTLRFFDNKKDADTFREEQISEAMTSQGLTRNQAENMFSTLEDREQEIIATATGEFSHGSGGLYTAARSEDGILYGLEGKSGQRITPFDALTRNIANVSRLAPINQWRLGLEQRWLNTARKLIGPQVSKFGELPSNIESTQAGAFLNRMAKQIRDWQGFPTREEQVYNAAVQELYEWSLRDNKGRGSKLIGWMKDKDPIAASRAAAFHSLLGWFNPAQLWVQAQGISVALSINLGNRATKIARHIGGFIALGDNAEHASQFAKAGKISGMSADEMKEAYSLWKKTGFEDSILQTADHAAAIRGHGIAMDAISRLADKGLIFYRHGEMFSRKYAFLTALDEFKETRKLTGPISNQELRGIVDRTNNLLLNMTKANRAQWQKGLASIPTQFFQVSAKSLETMLGFNDNLKPEERLRVLAGQIALYGAAGVPLMSLGANYALEWMGVTQEDIDNNPLLVKTWNDGFWGFTTLGIFGVDIELSSRGSLVRGVTDFVDNWMFSESNVATKLMGAFGTVNSRFWNEFTTQMRPLTFGAYSPDIVDLASLPLMPFLNTVSTWRNGEKAVFMQTMDQILTKNGDPTVARGFEIRESIAAAIGFRLTDEAKSYTLEQRVQHVKDVDRKTADLIIMRMNEAVHKESLGLADDEYRQETDKYYAAVYGSLDDERQKRVRDAVEKRILKKDKLTASINRYINNVYGRTTEGLSVILDGMLGTSIETVNKPIEE